jgi:signal peptidase I
MEELSIDSGSEVLPPEPAGTSPGKVLRDWIIVVAIALGAALLVRVYVLQQFYISGPSMETTLFENNRVLVNKLSYRLHDIHRGDVVVFDRITTSGGVIAHDDLIKRVIGVEGDTVEIKNCKVLVNSKVIDESYLDKEMLARPTPTDRCRVVDMQPITVPKKQLFVMGDNRPESFDSRSFGTIPEKLVIGRAFAIVWPFSRIATL